MNKKNYKLLKLHMNANPEYLFGHAEISGLLANGDEKVSSFKGYVRECAKRGVSSFNEECYNDFMKDCEREVKLDCTNIFGDIKH